MHKLLSLLCALPLAMMAAPRVAVVYSVWSNSSFKMELDATLKKLAWQYEPAKDKYENTRLGELSGKLSEYDYVIASSVANYVNTVDMAPYAEQWRAFLQKGGQLVVFDANYPSVLNQWVAKFGPQFACGTALCSAHTVGMEESRVVKQSDDMILRVPTPVGPRFAELYRHWAHLKGLGPDWKVLLSCADGEAVLAYQKYGKGAVTLCVASSVKHNPLAEMLLKNVDFWRDAAGRGIEILDLQTDVTMSGDELSGTKGCMVKLKVDPARYQQLEMLLRCQAAGRKELKWSVKADVPADGVVTLPLNYSVPYRGRLAYRLAVQSGSIELLHTDWEETRVPAVQAKLMRKHLYPGNKLEVKLDFTPEKLYRELLSGAQWRVDAGAWQPLASLDKQTLAIDAASLPNGEHALYVQLDYRPGFEQKLSAEDRERDWGRAVKLQFFKHPQARYMMRDDHVLLEDGKPFFPLGFYHVSWTETSEQRLAMAQDVAKYGYNAVHVGIRGNEAGNDSYGVFLDACAEMKLRVITEFGCKPEDVIAKYKDKPAVMGWNPGDEPAPKGILPEEMFRRYDTFKQLDYHHLAYTVICVPSQYANYAAGTDVLAPDPYPIPKGGMDVIYRRFSEAKAAANNCDTALWAVCQAFGGQKYTGWTRCPTPQEFRGMSYLALMAGAKGIIYYVYRDTAFDITKDPALWEAAQKFPEELGATTPWVLDGTYRQILAEKDGLYAGEWTLNGEKRLVLVNAGKAAVTATLETKASAVLYGDPQGLKMADGKLTLTVAPFERVVLK